MIALFLILSSLWRKALAAAAASGLDMPVEIFRAVIVGKFFAGLDSAHGEDEHTPRRSDRFAIGCAGVVYIARKISRNVTINGLAFRDLEKILSAVAICFRLAYRSTDIFDDACALGNFLLRKEAFATL